MEPNQDKYLIISSTAREIAALTARLLPARAIEPDTRPLFLTGGRYRSAQIDLLICGVGQLQAAYHSGRVLATNQYSMVFNFGIAGSFVDRFPKRTVVNVREEILADLGVEDRDIQRDLFEIGLLDPNGAPFVAGSLHAPEVASSVLTGLPAARSLTVNRVLGNSESISKVVTRYAPDIVNMEGAAIFYACLLAGVPFVSLRAISDRVAPRDKPAWDIPGAIAALEEKALLLLDGICS